MEIRTNNVIDSSPKIEIFDFMKFLVLPKNKNKEKRD